MSQIVTSEKIERKIYLIRGKRVMLDRDLAELYGVETGYMNRQVSRNLERFPSAFMFLLTQQEVRTLMCQFGTSKKGRGGPRKPPRAFTEHGILMLSSILNSKRAIQVNIQIMLIFTRFREMLTTHLELKRKIEQMEKKYDTQFKVVFDAIRKLMEETPAPPQRRQIGFHDP
jgi:hypothetical protein